jgi:DNA-binding NtrC family response regulator
MSSVLVIDDDLALCRIIQRMLSDGYKVQISQSVAEPSRPSIKNLLYVYVLDYKLPDGSGLDIAERIGRRAAKLPIIIISGYDGSAVG